MKIPSIPRSKNCLISANRLPESAAVAEGDLTVDAHPVTSFLTARPGQEQLGELFNGMLGKARGGLGSYNAIRKLAESASRTVEQTRSAFDGLAASIEDVSACITRVAQATEEVAEVASNTSAASQQVSVGAFSV